MRIIFLNSWFGKVGKPYFDFVKKASSKTDIFCFMEVTPELYLELSQILKGFKVLYEKGSLIESLGIICGQAIYIRKGISIIKSCKVSIYRQSSRDVGFMQFVGISFGKKKYCLGSLHGKTLPGTKIDTTTRLKQSQRVINFFADKDGPKIIGGDFNLNPDTRSIKMFEEAGYRNLIRDFGIKETRNRLSWEQFPNEEKQHFADYCFVSPEVKVQNFEVPNIEISDHLPLILDFEI